MIPLMLATLAPMLVPVGLDDAVLSQPETYLSDLAQAQKIEGVVEDVHCLSMPEDTGPYTLVCLSIEEWRDVFERASQRNAQEESVAQRRRAISMGARDAGSQ